jgi:hypothetical protein
MYSYFLEIITVKCFILKFLMATTIELSQLMVKLPIYSVLFLIYFRQSAGSGSRLVVAKGLLVAI